MIVGETVHHHLALRHQLASEGFDQLQPQSLLGQAESLGLARLAAGTRASSSTRSRSRSRCCSARAAGRVEPVRAPDSREIRAAVAPPASRPPTERNSWARPPSRRSLARITAGEVRRAGAFLDSALGHRMLGRKEQVAGHHWRAIDNAADLGPWRREVPDDNLRQLEFLPLGPTGNDLATRSSIRRAARPATGLRSRCPPRPASPQSLDRADGRPAAPPRRRPELPEAGPSRRCAVQTPAPLGCLEAASWAAPTESTRPCPSPSVVPAILVLEAHRAQRAAGDPPGHAQDVVFQAEASVVGPRDRFARRRAGKLDRDGAQTRVEQRAEKSKDPQLLPSTEGCVSWLFSREAVIEQALIIAGQPRRWRIHDYGRFGRLTRSRRRGRVRVDPEARRGVAHPRLRLRVKRGCCKQLCCTRQPKFALSKQTGPIMSAFPTSHTVWVFSVPPWLCERFFPRPRVVRSEGP